jgi:hypothetical protein
MLDDGDKYLFDHLHKCGGISLRTLFELLLGPASVSPMVSDRRAVSVVRALCDYPMITGHLRLSHDLTEVTRRRMITVFRDPVDRMVSLFSFLQAEDTFGMARQQDKSLSSFNDFLSNRTIFPPLRNWFTHHFAELRAPVFAPNSEEALRLAKDALEAYSVVGMADDLADTVDVMCWRLGWPAVESIPRENVTTQHNGKRYELTAVERRRAETMAECDLELYRHARKLFDAAKREAFRSLLGYRAGQDLPPLSPPARLPPTPAQTAPLDKAVSIIAVMAQNPKTHDSIVKQGEDVLVTILVRAFQTLSQRNAGFHIFDSSGLMVASTTLAKARGCLDVEDERFYLLRFTLPMILRPDFYTVEAWTGPADEPLRRHDVAPNATAFRVLDNSTAALPLDATATIEEATLPAWMLGEVTLCPDSPRVPTIVARNASFVLKVTVRNRSMHTLSPEGPLRVSAAYHWMLQDGTIVVFDGVRSALPHDLAPEDSLDMRMTVEAPSSPGEYRLQLAVVQEHVAWSAQGSLLAISVT